MAEKYKIGIIGTGFIARGLSMALEHSAQLEVSYVLTRRTAVSLNEFPLPRKKITRDMQQLITGSDLVVECSGDVIHGTVMAEQALAAGLPIVTMNAELQIVSGTMLARQGMFVEAEGDQPGTLARLDQDVRQMGFQPLVYGNIKRFLNLHPTPDEMAYWSKRQGISLPQVTSFTDGTKIQIEQALVANGLGASIAKRNLTGIACKDVEDGARQLAEIAVAHGQPISDYVLCPTGPAGVFIVATHNGNQQPYLEYLKLHQGPFYVILQPDHLCHLEIPKTILNVLSGAHPYRFNNSQQPTIQVAAVAKRALSPGEVIPRGSGSFTVRGEAVKIIDEPKAVPVSLLQDAVITAPVAEGQTLTFDDVQLPKSRALELWKLTLAEALAPAVQKPSLRVRTSLAATK